MKKAQIPNVIFDDILPHLMDSEVRVVIAIARKTFGFNKDADEISYSQFEKMTTYKRASLIRIMERLEIKGVINVRRVKGGSKKVSNTYSINLEWCKEDIESRLLQVTSHLITSSKSDLSCHLPAKKKPDHVTGGLHTKDNNTQNTEQNTPRADIHIPDTTLAPQVNVSRFTEPLKQYSEHVSKVDPIAMDYRLRRAVEHNSPETVENAIRAVVKAAKDSQYPKDKLPGSLSALLADPERVTWWARRYKPAELPEYLSDPEKLARAVKFKRDNNQKLTPMEEDACRRLAIA